ncbi:pancreatic lipase-related protein 2-like [Arctopsyche grandis]|uniref:pancreatic lipase-related protein 2-like n=1 Tax=Arctopsyche grandis TaxID=121162 RepID=UPI00406D8B10
MSKTNGKIEDSSRLRCADVVYQRSPLVYGGHSWYVDHCGFNHNSDPFAPFHGLGDWHIAEPVTLVWTSDLQETGVVANIVDLVEKSFVRFFLTDCVNTKNILRLNYEQMSLKTIPRLSSVSLVFFSDNFKINFSLNEAASAIPIYLRYDHNKSMTIIIHGHSNSPYTSEIDPIIQTMKEKGATNVFALDHSDFMGDNYYAASTHVRFIGEALGAVLADMHERGIEDVHLVGHSLGAHIAGFAGKMFKKRRGIEINHITGLDPAGPCFFNELPSNRLTKADARFVDVIHTDIHTSGYPKQLGHVDFYPNGGENMPGCIIGQCSHVLSIDYYKSSVENPAEFLAVMCKDWITFKKGKCSKNPRVVMGYWIYKNIKKGRYFLETSPAFPYGIGESGIKKYN